MYGSLVLTKKVTDLENELEKGFVGARASLGKTDRCQWVEAALTVGMDVGMTDVRNSQLVDLQWDVCERR